jgi:plastocyanin domain-containing protein
MVMVAVVTGCAAQSTMQEPAAQPMQAASQGGAMPKMTCPMCTKGAPAVEKGTATEENGVQVVRITQKEGYYSPNEITIKAGMPARLIFTGDAKDCSGKPKIAELNKQVDFTQTGEATMDLGMVSPGTYKLTCGMDSAGGSLVVE